MKRAHCMPFGASLHAGAGDGAGTASRKGARFRLWAPARERVSLELLRRAGPANGAADAALEVLDQVVMTRLPGGWHQADVADASAGLLYRFRLDQDLAVSDPASRCNPLDVHGPSELIDPHAHEWADGDWTGRPWHEAVVYELHVGTFTPVGTFDAARERLDELAALGITAIELMPLAEFPGARNWGYDGVLPFAPDASYGRPEDLKRFIERAHALGMMVLLDVVYNHFGPEGNYLHAYAPQFFNPARLTPWGAALDFDGPYSGPVREFFVHNALYWVEEYGFDGLRLDAVHAIEDRSSPDIIESIAQALHAGPGRERLVHLVLENDRNEARRLAREVSGSGEQRPRQATAQWNDDIHHALHVLVTGETDGYYADYAHEPVEKLGRALAEGFVYQGDESAFRGGARRGERSAHLPPAAFVAYLQTHDQVGNRAFGERLDAIADGALMPAALACVLLGPQVPMLFMGEEYAASTPFLFFCDFGPELAEAVRNGRREEFGRFEAFRDQAAREAIPDPNGVETFAASKLKWHEREASPHRERLALVRELLRVRRALTPRFGRIECGGTWEVRQGALGVRWNVAAAAGASGAAAGAASKGRQAADPAAEAGADEHGGVLALHVNFGAEPIELAAAPSAEALFTHALDAQGQSGRWTLARGGVLLTLERGHG